MVDRRDYERLQNHLADVTEWLYQEHQKVQKLQKLRSRGVLQGAGFVLSDVIAASVELTRADIIINRGSEDHISNGQFVLAENSVIGRVSEAAARQSKVVLVTDPSARTPVILKTADRRIEAVMRGAGSSSAKISLISCEYQVKDGDEVFVCKDTGYLDSPLIVGRIAQCRKNEENPLLWDITVRTVCDLERLKSVAVVIMNP